MVDQEKIHPYILLQTSIPRTPQKWITGIICSFIDLHNFFTEPQLTDMVPDSFILKLLLWNMEDINIFIFNSLIKRNWTFKKYLNLTFKNCFYSVGLTWQRSLVVHNNRVEIGPNSQVFKMEAISTNLTICDLCGKEFENPKLLPCLHSFCLNCLDDYCESSTLINKSFVECPNLKCSKLFEVPPSGCKEFPNNIFIERLAKTSSNEVSIPMYVPNICNHGGSEMRYCKNCKEVICPECSMIIYETEESMQPQGESNMTSKRKHCF